MHIKERREEIVYPAGAHHRPVVHRLSENDQVLSLRFFMSVLYFFREGPTDAQLWALQRSLSEALAAFYPFAGRLVERIGDPADDDDPGRHMGGGRGPAPRRLDVSCMGQGAIFCEAWADARLEAFEPDFQPRPEFHHLVPADTQVLLQVQLTHFECGGACLGVRSHHTLCDGVAMGHFMQSWARLASSTAAAKPLSLPDPYAAYSPLGDIYESKIDLAAAAGTISLRENYPHFRTVPPRVPAPTSPAHAVTSKVFRFTPASIDALKKETGGRFSSFQLIVAHLWQAVTVARNEPSPDEVLLAFYIDGRPRLEPPLPPTFMGNAAFQTYSRAPASDLTSKPLSHAASLVKDAISRMTDSYIISLLACMRKHSPPLSYCSCASPNLSLTTWTGLPFADLDFVWGKPACVRVPPFSQPADGLIILIPSPLGRGYVDAMVTLKSMYMQKLEEVVVA